MIMTSGKIKTPSVGSALDEAKGGVCNIRRGAENGRARRLRFRRKRIVSSGEGGEGHN